MFNFMSHNYLTKFSINKKYVKNKLTNYKIESINTQLI